MKKIIALLLLCLYWPSKAQQTPAVCYEIFVRSFADSNGDGIGDINGITGKLDYLQSLGIEALWLTPVSKSPSYHKYDVTDYKSIDPEYGTLEDYKKLIAEAHKRGIKIIKDLVINHTSDKHPWFLEAKKGKENPYRDYYVWLTPQKIDSMGIATRERTGDSWEITPWHFANPNDTEKYYALFWGGMPDLNYDNPKVRAEIYAIGQYWLKEVGVDGFRLDAAKHIYPDWEAEKSHQFWVEFKQKMQAVQPNVYFVGEVWTSADKVAPFFKGLPANFHLDACFAIQKMVKEGKSEGFIEQLLKDYQAFGTQNPNFIDATIIDNHDQTRIGTVLKGNTDQMKMAAQILLTLPGQPYIYYGEEIGMLGDKPDENIREPFLWDIASQDVSRTKWMPTRFTTDQSVVPLAQQQKDPQSVFQTYKKLIAFRKAQPALRQVIKPNLALSDLKADGIFAFVRPHATGNLLVIHNLSATAKVVTLPLSEKQYRKVKFSSSPTTLRGLNLTIPAAGLVILGK